MQLIPNAKLNNTVVPKEIIAIGVIRPILEVIPTTFCVRHPAYRTEHTAKRRKIIVTRLLAHLFLLSKPIPENRKTVPEIANTSVTRCIRINAYLNIGLY